MTNESCSAASDNAFLMLAQYTLIALGLLLICLKSKGILHQLDLWLEFFLTSVPAISVELELSNDEKDAPKGSQTLVDKKQPHILNCYNPSSGCCLALSIPVPNMSEKDVDQVCQAAHTAQKTWSETTFAQRRLVLLSEGELWLQKSYRSTGPLMMHKDAFVQYVPVGVLGVIAQITFLIHHHYYHYSVSQFTKSYFIWPFCWKCCCHQSK
mmetsp:Transcript_1960/g.2737  ORF Transcript_1960/g.2737 Transcript_1960/m.2737 type:complete len:211 (+) Transcript_1960:440-1072(+)